MADKNLELINSMSDNAVLLDIGANVGRYTAAMAKLPTRKVYAFEPEPKNLVRLRESIKNFDNVEVHGLALGNEIGIAKLMIHPGNPGGHSIHEALNGNKWKHKLENSIDVAVITLDKWVEENNIERIDGIKLDVEAHEVEVIEGAMETLKRFHPSIVLETHGTVNVVRLKDLLIECGYTVNQELKIDSAYIFEYGKSNEDKR